MKLWVAKQNNVLHQIIQLFILLNACVLFTDMLNNYISTAHYLFLHYLQCFSVNFCYRFNFFHFISFFVHRCFHIVFQRCFLSNFLKICSKVFSQGFSEVFLGNFLKLCHRFFDRVIFTGLFESQVFSQGPKFWNFLKI